MQTCPSAIVEFLHDGKEPFVQVVTAQRAQKQTENKKTTGRERRWFTNGAKTMSINSLVLFSKTVHLSSPTKLSAKVVTVAVWETSEQQRLWTVYITLRSALCNSRCLCVPWLFKRSLIATMLEIFRTQESFINLKMIGNLVWRQSKSTFLILSGTNCIFFLIITYCKVSTGK